MFVDASESRTITYVMFSPRRRCVVVKYMYLRCDTSQMATREADPCKEGFVPFPKNPFGFEEKKNLYVLFPINARGCVGDSVIDDLKELNKQHIT